MHVCLTDMLHSLLQHTDFCKLQNNEDCSLPALPQATSSSKKKKKASYLVLFSLVHVPSAVVVLDLYMNQDEAEL